MSHCARPTLCDVVDMVGAAGVPQRAGPMAGVAASASDDSAVAAIPSPGAAGAPGAAEGGNAVTVPPTSEDNLVTLALRWYGALERSGAPSEGLRARRRVRDPQEPRPISNIYALSGGFPRA